jgi:hypothetical protein
LDAVERTIYTGSTSARRGSINGGSFRHFNVGARAATFGRSTLVTESLTIDSEKNRPSARKCNRIFNLLIFNTENGSLAYQKG